MISFHIDSQVRRHLQQSASGNASAAGSPLPLEIAVGQPSHFAPLQQHEPGSRPDQASRRHTAGLRRGAVEFIRLSLYEADGVAGR